MQNFFMIFQHDSWFQHNDFSTWFLYHIITISTWFVSYQHATTNPFGLDMNISNTSFHNIVITTDECWVLSMLLYAVCNGRVRLTKPFCTQHEWGIDTWDSQQTLTLKHAFLQICWLLWQHFCLCEVENVVSLVHGDELV